MCFLYSTERSWSITEGNPISIGRNAENTIEIFDRHVSRFHASIYREGSETFIKDLDSSNGTFINGKKIKIVELKEGSRIMIGNQMFWFSTARTELKIGAINRVEQFIVKRQKIFRLVIFGLTAVGLAELNFFSQLFEVAEFFIDLIGG